MTNEHTLEHVNGAWDYVTGLDGLIHLISHGLLYLAYAFMTIAVIFAVIAVIVMIRNFWISTEEPSNDGRPPKD